jgi:ceramide glucosyltransferase
MSELAVVLSVWTGAVGLVATWAALCTRNPVVRRRDSPAGPLPSTAPRRSDAGTPAPSVLLLRPCAGRERGLDLSLRSSQCADPGVRLRFLVAQAIDEAANVASVVSADLAELGRDVRVVITVASAPNMKAAQLARALEAEPERAEIVAVADSDVALTAEVLAELLDPLVAGEAEATWVPAVEGSHATLADRASASVLDASLHAFPLLAGLDARSMVGKVFAVRRDALDATGGFAGLVDCLGEDVELSRRLRHRGMRVRPCPAVATSLASGRSWTEVIQRYTRWVAVVRAQRVPLLASYPLLFAATPLVLAAGIAAMPSDMTGATRAIAFALAVRLGIAVLARRRSGHPARPTTALFDGLMADALLLAAFASALTRRYVVWRGVRLELVSQAGTVGARRLRRPVEPEAVAQGR